MSYADFDAVNARLGRFAGIFEIADKHPDQDDIEGLLTDTAADIDSAIRAHGFDPTTLTADAEAALVDLNAYGALVRALPTANLGPDGAELLAVARAVWGSAMGENGSVAAGTHPVFAEIEAGAGGGGLGPSAGDLWSDEPTYGSALGLEQEARALDDTNLAPQFRRGQTL